jgi:Cysteine rich repeat
MNRKENLMHAPLPRLGALLGAAALLVAPLVLAQGAPPPPKKGGACRDDIATLCPGIQPGPGARKEIGQCLASQQDKVSAACKAQIDAEKARIEAAKAACQPDIEKFCANVPQGGGQIRQCLRQHQSELSDACKAAHQGKRGPPPASPPPAQPAQK